MLKNKLYPYIEKYINEYLYGFTSEQLNVGVMNGTIILDRLNIRPDRVNEKLDNLDIPIWVKAGRIEKIRISCSLMNFIGEKPLEVVIDDIDLVLTPSFKWILKNLPTFIEESESHFKEAYDPMDNNSHDIFNKKVNIYDSSVLKQKEKLYQLFTDKSKISEIINRIFTKCLKFYYQKPYLINIKVNNVHLRFEDDQLVNYQNDIGLGVKIKSLQMGLSAEGSNKKNNFKVESVNVYWEPKARVLIPSKVFLDSLDKENNISEKYYEYLKSLKFNEVVNAGIHSIPINKNNSVKYECINLIDNFNCMGNFGIQLVESGNLDFFAQSREKNFKFFLQIATSELNINAYPDIVSIIQRTVDFMKSFYIIEPIQDFKPMRKPYNKLSEIIKKTKDDNFEFKRKMVVRDWFYYLIWFNRFKKAIYGNAFKNPLQAEFSKYFNICCLPANDSNSGGSSSNVNQFKISSQQNLNDSISYRKHDKDNSMIYADGINTSRDKVEKSTKEEDLNPEKINLVIASEILIKGVNLNLHLKYNSDKTEYAIIKMSGLNFKSFISKEKFENVFDMKTFNISLSSDLKIKKSLDERIKDSILSSQSNTSSIKSTYTSKMITSTKTSDRINLLPTNKINDSFTSDSVSVFNIQGNHEGRHDNISIFSREKEREREYMVTNPPSNDPLLNKKLNVLNDTLDQMARRKKDEKTNSVHDLNSTRFNAGTSRDKSRDTHIFKNKINIVNLLLTEETSQQTMNLEEKPNKINLSKVINEYNKTIIKQKKSIIVTNPKEKINYSSTVPNEDDRINLYLLEMTSNQTGHSTNSSSSVINFKFSKTHNKEALNIHLGSTRVNLTQEYKNFLVHLIADYATLNLNKFKSMYQFDKSVILDSTKLKNEKSLLHLKNLILEKITSDRNFTSNIQNRKVESIMGSGSNPNQTTQSEVIDYISYLKRDLSGFDRKLLDEGKFEVNYIFGFFNKNLEINFIHHDINLIFYTKDLNNLLSKVKLPNFNLKFQLNNSSTNNSDEACYLKFMDFEMTLNDLNEAREIINNILTLAEDRLKGNLIFIEPVIKKLTEESRMNAIMEANNNFTHQRGFSNFQSQHNIMQNFNLNPNSSIPLPSKKSGPGMQGLNNIIQNNIQRDSEFTPIKSDRASAGKDQLSQVVINNTITKNIESSKATVVNTEKDRLPTYPGKITDNQYTETIQCDDLNYGSDHSPDDELSSPSDIINIENSAENISEYEDLGIIIEKSKMKEGNNKDSLIVKNIQSFSNFNRLDTDKDKEQDKIKISDEEMKMIKDIRESPVNQVNTPTQKLSNPLNNLNFNLVKPTNPGYGYKKPLITSITANKTSSSGVKLKFKNTGNINHMNINIK
jgi:hypothetical protein